jgi:hypothetical protein
MENIKAKVKDAAGKEDKQATPGTTLSEVQIML